MNTAQDLRVRLIDDRARTAKADPVAWVQKVEPPPTAAERSRYPERVAGWNVCDPTERELARRGG